MLTSGPRIFVSYARSDGRDFARDLSARLRAAGFSLWRDLADMEGGRDWWQQIEEAIRAVEYLILVITPASLRSEYVRKEWRLARQEGRCVIPVLADNSLTDSEAFRALPGWMQRAHFVDPDNPEQWTRLIEALKRPCEARRVPFMASNRPEGYVERPKEMEDLIGHLVRGETREPVAITGVLQGAGGFGKTTLARALCHDPRIEEAFDDGILWVTIGEQPGPLMGRIGDLIFVLTGTRPPIDQEQTATAELAKALGEQRLLLVIDDVWDVSHLTPFLQGGPHCARLVTTRNRATVRPSMTTVPVDAMQPSEAVDLLGAGLPGGEHMALASLAKRLGEWPLLLKLVNAQLHERVTTLHEPLANAIDRVEYALAKRGITAFDVENASQRDQAVAATLGASLALLSEDERQRYAELAVFPEDAKVPIGAIETLWAATAGLDDLDSEYLLRKLFRFSLLLDLDLAQRRMQLHDVFRTYLLTSDARTRRALHEALVKAYRARCDGRWAQLADDGYVFAHLPSHLAEAGQREELRTLLLDYPWLAAKLRVTHVQALIADCNLQPEDAEIRLLQGAIRLSIPALTRDPNQLALHLAGRLLGTEGRDLQQLRKVAEAGVTAECLRPKRTFFQSPRGPLVQTFFGHTQSVNGALVLSRGTKVLSWSDDATLRIWDLASAQTLHTLKGHIRSVDDVLDVADSAMVLSSSLDGTLRVWDLASATQLHTLEGHTRELHGALVFADGTRALSWSVDGTLRLWDLISAQTLQVLEGHTAPVWGALVLADNSRALSWSDDETLRLWDLISAQTPHILEGHTATVWGALALPDGGRALSWSKDGTLRLWDLASAQMLLTLKGHTDSIDGALIFADGARALSWSVDGTLRLWDLFSAQTLQVLEGHTEPVRGALVLADNSRAVSWSDDGTLRLWDLFSAQTLQVLEGHTEPVRGALVLADNSRAISWSDDGTLRLWDLISAQTLQVLEGHTEPVCGALVLADNSRTVSWSDDGTLRLWNLASAWAQPALEGDMGPISGALVLPDGARTLSWSYDWALRLWEISSGQMLQTLKGHTDWVRGALVLADGAHALSWSDDGTLRLWDLASAETLHTLQGHDGAVSGALVLADGARALSWSKDWSLILWNLHSGRAIARFIGEAEITTVVAARDDLFVAGSANGAVHILELRGG